MNGWYVFEIIGFILVVYSIIKGRDAIMSGLMLGGIIGFVIGLVYLLLGDGFNLHALGKTLIVFVLIGAYLEFSIRLIRSYD